MARGTTQRAMTEPVIATSAARKQSPTVTKETASLMLTMKEPVSLETSPAFGHKRSDAIPFCLIGDCASRARGCRFAPTNDDFAAALCINSG